MTKREFRMYQFEPRAVYFNWWVRFENYWVGRRERKNVLKNFCMETGIDYPPRGDKKYDFPEKFLVKTDWMGYLGKLRDEIILVRFGEYHTVESRLQEELNRIEGEINQAEEILMRYKGELTTLKAKLGHEKGLSNSQYIDLEGRINNREAKVKNQHNEIQAMKIDLKNYQDIQQANEKAWLKQLANINALLEETTKKHCYYAAKHVRNRLNFTNLDFAMSDYGEETKKLLGMPVKEPKAAKKSVRSATAGAAVKQTKGKSAAKKGAK